MAIRIGYQKASLAQVSAKEPVSVLSGNPSWDESNDVDRGLGQGGVGPGNASKISQALHLVNLILRIQKPMLKFPMTGGLVLTGIPQAFPRKCQRTRYACF